jgi:Na+/glutamate symporter
MQWIFILSMAVIVITPFRIASPLLCVVTLFALGVVVYAMYFIQEFFKVGDEANWWVQRFADRVLRRRRGATGQEEEYESLVSEEV